MTLSPSVATTVIKAACTLHNLLMKDTDPFVQLQISKMNANLQIARRRECGLQPMNRTGYHTGKEACKVRHLFACYFCSKEGFILWQDKCAHVSDLQD